MTFNPLVSIIINNYNGEKYLGQAVDSVLEQTWKNFEVIFWDNQSIDLSKEIFQSYKDPRLKYFYAPEHTPLYNARNLAINESRGEFLAFLDVDDFWFKDKLEKQMKLFDDPSVGFAGSNYCIVNELTNRTFVANKKPLSEGWVVESFLKNYRLGLLTLMIRKRSFEGLDRPFDSRFHMIGDMDLAVRMAAKYRFAYVDEVLACNRKHGKNASIIGLHTQIEEMEVWAEEMSNDLLMGQHFVAGYFQAHITYVKALNELFRSNRKGAFVLLKKMRWGSLKIRIIAALFLPVWLLKRLKR